MTDVARNLAAVHDRIRAACARAGRDAAGVTLLAVSKLQPIELIVEAARAGHRDFAENYAQELKSKALSGEMQPFAQPPAVSWHCIGPLQTNKAKVVAACANAFHALDRIEIAQELAKRRTGPPLPCFVEVNVAGEESKHGVAPADLRALVDGARALAGITVVGLMCMPPQVEDAPEASRPHFVRLRELAASVGVAGLSMGTTDDFEVAVEEGATHVRVGRAIFGARTR